jgi:hypothetical protein
MRIIKNSKKLIVTLMLAALSSSMAFGQGGLAPQSPSTTKGAVIKGKAPVNQNVLKVKLPKAEEASLPNGLKVVFFTAIECQRSTCKWWF